MLKLPQNYKKKTQYILKHRALKTLHNPLPWSLRRLDLYTMKWSKLSVLLVTLQSFGRILLQSLRINEVVICFRLHRYKGKQHSFILLRKNLFTNINSSCISNIVPRILSQLSSFKSDAHIWCIMSLRLD